MATIPYIKGTTADAHITVGHVGGELPTVAASEQGQPNVLVHRTLRVLLDKAAISPPPLGKLLSISYVNEKLATAGLTADERLDLKQGLVRLNLVELGKPVDV